jgi:hypothetical protein
MVRLFDDVVVIELPAFPGIRFTSCPGIGSSIFAVNHDVVGHLFLPSGIV